MVGWQGRELTATHSLGLYLHIPFCRSICHYCNFNRGLLDPDLKRRYLDALATEVRRAGDGTAVDTIYFGGGTPSLLEADEVAQLLVACADGFAVAADAEITLETNPDTASPARLRGWLSAGVTRLSVGVQSFQDAELRRLGRAHSAAMAREAIAAARGVGCRNISLDLMIWLPDQTRDDCRASLETLADVAPDHVSIYLLELYPNAPLRDEMARAGWGQAPDRVAAAMYLEAFARTDAAGYVQYEISNTARPGRQCRHNLKYWQDGEWLGFGCGAHSTRRGCRWKNVSDTGDYIRAVAEERPPAGVRHRLPWEERIGDALITGLRLADGIDLGRFSARYGVDVMERHGEALAPFVAQHLVTCAAGRLRLTRQGMLLANEVLGVFV